jgi:hypothetical protein
MAMVMAGIARERYKEVWEQERKARGLVRALKREGLPWPERRAHRYPCRKQLDRIINISDSLYSKNIWQTYLASQG